MDRSHGRDAQTRAMHHAGGIGQRANLASRDGDIFRRRAKSTFKPCVKDKNTIAFFEIGDAIATFFDLTGAIRMRADLFKRHGHATKAEAGSHFNIAGVNA